MSASSPSAKRLPAAVTRRIPSRLYVELTSRCNLRCRMCVKQSAGPDVAPEGDMNEETFAALERMFPDVEALILNGVGESLLHPRLEEFVRRARRAMPERGWIGFQSNGQLLDESRALALAEAGLDCLCLSVDARTPELLRACRAGADLKRLERAMAALRAARGLPGARLRHGVEVVLMRDSFAELPAVLDWAGERGASFAIVTHMLPYDEAVADQTLFGANLDESLAFFGRKQEEARRQGVDMARFFTARWKFHWSDEDRRAIEFVKEMVREAEGRGTPLHLRNLMQRGEPEAERLAEVFREAERVAAARGMRLRLPAILPAFERRCDFIEDGTAFVSWDGRLSPCYALWRRYACHAYGRRKLIAPKLFGDLSANAPLDAWNAPDWRRFREIAASYEYPYCSNCSVYPCDYVDSEEFESDCWGEEAPCGDCLWCHGLLQCLGQGELP